jgi:hypothetical protein
MELFWKETLFLTVIYMEHSRTYFTARISTGSLPSRISWEQLIRDKKMDSLGSPWNKG